MHLLLEVNRQVVVVVCNSVLHCSSNNASCDCRRACIAAHLVALTLVIATGCVGGALRGLTLINSCY